MAVSADTSKGALNSKKLRSAERRETITILSLSLPAILAVCVVIVIPVGWLFSL